MTAFDLAQRYIGVKEISGERNHPLISWWLSLCGFSMDSPDEIAWCSAFVNGIAWELRLPRSKSAAARSWLAVGIPIEIDRARPGFDVVIFKRGTGIQPGPEVLNAPGHVAFFAGIEGNRVLSFGGNQGNVVSMISLPISDILGVRRLTEA
mgnify:CR=1 FL=1